MQRFVMRENIRRYGETWTPPAAPAATRIFVVR